jgi:hypothetical protein
MKHLFSGLLLFSMILTGCSSSHGITNIEPKTGAIEIPANGQFRMWNNSKHGSFTVMLTNSSASQSVELYKVYSDGKEKWITPSLLANTSQEVAIPADGHLFIKNFNANIFTVTYKISE